MRLKVANGAIVGGGSREAGVGLEFWQHDRLDRPDQAKRLMLQGNFYEGNLPDWDIIMGYDFMVSNSAGAVPRHATLIRLVDPIKGGGAGHVTIDPPIQANLPLVAM